MPIKEFKVMVIKKFTKLGRKMDEHSEKYNKGMDGMRKYQGLVIELKIQ